MLDGILAAFAADPGPAGIDTETTSVDSLWRGLECRGVSLALVGRSWYLPISHADSQNYPPVTVAALLRRLHAAHPTRTWDFFNLKYDASVLRTLGLDVFTAPNLWDASIGAWLEDENLEIRDLKGRCAWLWPDEGLDAPQKAMRASLRGLSLAEIEDGYYYGPGGKEAAEGRRRPNGYSRAQARKLAEDDPRRRSREMWDLTATEMAPYAAQDAAITLRLATYQRSLSPTHGIARAMPREVEVARVLTGMEATGIRVDAQAAEMAHARAVSRLSALDSTFEGASPASHPQLAKLIYEDWGFPVFERTPTGEPSTARSALELLGDDPRITALLEWRRLNKALTAYYRPYLDCLDSDDRIHTSFRQTGTKTGRFSSANPNLQQIPREETNTEVRALFRPTPGYLLVEFDLKQAEVRVAAALSHEEALLAALRAGVDPYDQVARDMGVSRQIAKTVVLANSYTAGPGKLAATLLKGTGKMVTPRHVQAATELQSHLAATYPRLARTRQRLEGLARIEGRIPLPPPGRYRHFRGAGHPPEAYKDAWNAACQGGVGELVKSLMVELDRADVWTGNGARPLLQIHDALVAEVPPGRVEWLAGEVQAVLDDVSYYRSVPLPIEVKIWGAP